ncbi:MAG TPA: DUF5677 domain-containing protein [Candidatus Acidoferrales bacterium]|nr:DUF5677 domain-containing protein [Candidatus Acidoferrales bacterium]
MGKDKGKSKKKKAEKSYSGIDAHKRHKKVLVPPLMAIPGIALQSWLNDRLPEMLWSALLISVFGRDRALLRFRAIAALIPELPPEKRIVQPTLSSLAALEEGMLHKFLSKICSDGETKDALRPLLHFDDLPAKAHWARVIDQSPAIKDWEYLQAAVLPVLDHQSQEATDCRWLRVLFQTLSGQLHLPTREHVREILEYPNFGLQQKVRPTIRSMEGMIDQFSKPTSSWPQSFWNQCLRDSPCEPRHTMETEWSPHITTSDRRVRQVREALERHEKSCLKTTEVDARHDAAFGFGAYALAILDELLSLGNSTAIIGRIGLRTLLESYVVLVHLAKRDDPSLWMAYRQYGSGQAKLAFLKLDDPASTIPSSVNPEILRHLANEDRWLEFVPIDLGHWGATDLRKLSEESGVKPDYDRLYPWTSAFTHGNWAAVRNTCFDLCVNPLHRLHRRLRADTADLGDVIPDACELVDKILDAVDGLYPGFTSRVRLPQSTSASSSSPTAGAATAKRPPIGAVQREFFDILDEFFRRATGCSAEDFSPLDSFGERIRAKASKLGTRGGQALLYAHEALRTFYGRFGPHLFSEAKNLGGLKLVLGGTSRFGESQFKSVLKMLLYADTILIPDPILPWIESPRAEERFRNVQLLEAAFVLLHLKPLADADLPLVPMLVFPSFEKSLDERDPTTQTRMSLLIAQILSHFLGRKLYSIAELQDFAINEEVEFMRTVDQKKLFVAPGGRVGQPLEEALAKYSEEIKQWRSDGFQGAVKDLPKGLLLLNGLMERLAPQYHLLENAQELSSCPMLSLTAPWHYYSLMSTFFLDRLRAKGYLEDDSAAALLSHGETSPEWLGNVPVSGLVELLTNGENESFRTGARKVFSELHNTPLSDLNRVVPEVSKGLASILKEQSNAVHTLQEKYKLRHGEERVRSYVTRGATYIATLAPTFQDVAGPAGKQMPSEGESESPVEQHRPANSLLAALAVADED